MEKKKLMTLIEKIEVFRKAIEELKKHPNSIPMMRQAQIAGWNVAISTMPDSVAFTWNKELPNNLHVNLDSFRDKGQTPDGLTDQEMTEIQKLRGKPIKYGEKGFDPFWTWKFVKPLQSPLEIEQNKTKWTERIRANKDSGDKYGYGNDRYHGD